MNKFVQTNSGTVHGNMIQAETISNSFNTTTTTYANDKEAMQAIEKLLEQIATLSKTPQAAPLFDEAERLKTELARPNPSKRHLKLSLEGIKETAQTVGAIAVPILATVGSLIEFFSR